MMNVNRYPQWSIHEPGDVSMPRTSTRKNGVRLIVTAILLAGVGVLPQMALAQVYIPGTCHTGDGTPLPDSACTGGPSGGLPPGVMQQWMIQKMYQDQQEAAARQQRAAAEAARQQNEERRRFLQEMVDSRINAEERREQEAALQRTRVQFEQGKRDVLDAMKDVASGDVEGSGASTNFFSLKRLKPIPHAALSTSGEREKAQTSQCFDVGGCAPVSLPPLHLGSPHDLSAVPTWVQQTPQYQVLAATLRKLEAQAAEKARALQAAQQALVADPGDRGTVQAQVEALQMQVTELQAQIAAQDQQMRNFRIELEREGPPASGPAPQP